MSGEVKQTQICEGIWETGLGQWLVITKNPRPLHGKNWTDGLKVYSDDGVWESGNGRHDLVKYLGPLPDSLRFLERNGVIYFRRVGDSVSIPAEAMRANVPYTVTRASENREFQVGDRVRLTDTGCLVSLQAQGWIDAEDVSEATRGMRVTLYQEQRQ